MDKDPSPLDTLRQLKEWLDAGTITPQEFATLKQKLLFSETPETPKAPAPAQPKAEETLPTQTILSDLTPARPPVSFTEPTVTSAPIEEPLLPPITHRYTSPAPETPPTPIAPGFSQPVEVGRPGASPTEQEQVAYAPTKERLEEEVPVAPYTAPSRSPLATVLIVGGIIALLAIVAYLMLGNRESERLTSTTLTAADTLTAHPETGPQAEQTDLPPAAAPETIRVAPVVPPTPAPSDSVAEPTTPAPAQQAPAAPEPAVPNPATEEAAQSRVLSILNSYYEDLKTAPFAATTFFAPRVERFYTMQNTTPAAINDELTRSHFPEFLEAESQIEPGTMKVSAPVNDGSRVVTYTEKSRALRQSLQKRQQTRALVRIRFDKNFKIVYLRQEKLLENTFSE